MLKFQFYILLNEDEAKMTIRIQHVGFFCILCNTIYLVSNYS